MRPATSLLFAAALSVIVPATAADDPAVAKLAALLRMPAADVSPSPIAGIYQIKHGPDVAYVTADGKYVLRGDIISVDTGVNLSAVERAKARLTSLDQIGEQNMVVFGLARPRHTLTVLTDIDCQYCRALNEDTPALNAAGVEVRYLPFPRGGVDSPSWQKAVAVWCAKDRKNAYLEAMHGAAMTPDPKCDPAPVLAGFNLARQLGMDGTPILITEKGQIINGYMPAADLIRLLDSPALMTQGG